MRIRTTAAAVLVAAAGTFALSGVAHAGPDERDCEDFSSQRQAQAVLDSADGDPARLDAVTTPLRTQPRSSSPGTWLFAVAPGT